jgi:dihydroneopterin aldolase
MGTINLRGLEFHGFHGLYPEEQVKGNRFTVDVRIDLEFTEKAFNDQIEGTIDYVEVYRLVSEEMVIPKKLLETLASSIAKKIKVGFPEASQVEVSITKHNPPIGGPCDKVTVTVRET